MKKQRETNNLGINRSRQKEEIYKFIENKFGPQKRCSRTLLKNKFALMHEGKNPLPIRNFALLINKCVFSDKGKIISCTKIPLQSACIECDKKYRRARIEASRNVFKDFSNEDIYLHYIKTYGSFKKCSVCKKNLKPKEFGISKSMETGLHNQCLKCSKEYSEAVGNRWIIYSPQGRNQVRLNEDNLIKDPSKDHIWSLSKGGSDNNENIVFMGRGPNSSKSNSIPIEIKKPNDLKKTMISKRYWSILNEAIKDSWDIEKLDRALSKAVNDLIKRKSKMTDIELTKFFENEKRENNTKHNIQRAVKKFREYCKNSKSLDF